MRTVRVTRLLALSLLSAWVALGTTRAEGVKGRTAGPQTSPSEKKTPPSKPKVELKEPPGIHTVKGRILGVREDPPSVVVQDFAEAATLVREQMAKEPDTQVQAWLGGLELSKEAIAQLKKPKD